MLFRANTREQSRRLDEAERHERDLEQLSGRLVAMQENERKALSRELHDGIGQVLAALRVEISHLGSASSPADGQACLERAYSLSDDAIRSVRNIALLLRPSILDDLGLQAALRGQAKDFTTRTGIHCEVFAEDFPDTLPDALRTCVYRVAQEALNNCQKHSSASNVHVRLRVVGKSFQLVVEDDGVGFQVAANGNSPRRMGLGMIGMRERAVNLGGSLAVHSMLGHGTRISLTLPCEPANQLVNWGSEPRC
jgi:signal transduction histidine kinase